MKGDVAMIKMYGSHVQKQMDEDYIEMIKEEQDRVYTQGSTQKVTPAYEYGDMFEDQRIQNKLKLQRAVELERRQQAHLVKPDRVENNMIVVMPNE